MDEPARRQLVIIVLVAVLLRVMAAVAMGDEARPMPGIHDQVSYDRLAWNVAQGMGFRFEQPWWPLTGAGEPTAHWSYLYTGFVAAVYAVVGHHPLAARLIQAVALGALSTLGAHRLGSRLGGPRAGLWAAGLSAGYVYFIYYGAALMTEAATMTAILWMLEWTLRQDLRPTWRGWVVFGLLIGVAGLLRQVALLPVPLLALWLLHRRPTGATVLGVATSAALSLALILPVTWHNWQTFDRFVLLNTNAGYAFYWANHPIHGTRFHGILPSDGPGYRDLIPEELRHLDEAALNDALLARGMSFVREDPVRYLRLSLSRLEDYFRFWPSAESSLPSNLSRVLSFGLAWPFMLVGLRLARHRRTVATPLWLYAGSYTLLHLLSWALVRYRLPVDAVLLPFAALAVIALWDRIAPGRSELASAA